MSIVNSHSLLVPSNIASRCRIFMTCLNLLKNLHFSPLVLHGVSVPVIRVHHLCVIDRSSTMLCVIVSQTYMVDI